MSQVVHAAQQVRWYAEALPSSWVELQRRMDVEGRAQYWLPFERYREIAQEVGVDGKTMLQASDSSIRNAGGCLR